LAPSANHDQCASIFNAAGIYMLLDVNSPLPNGALSRTAPWETYNPDYMKQVFGVIESFKNYPNVVGFFAANEVINEDSVIQAPEYIRVSGILILIATDVLIVTNGLFVVGCHPRHA
jgi:hypothetical protein